ncbi:MAG: S-methyl-5-thioribose kinase [Paenibacillaceae bacterium]
MMYRALTEAAAVEYARSVPGLFSGDAPLQSREIGDGNLNLVFQVRENGGEGRSVIIKQALPYIRVIGDSYPLTLDRARIECEVLQIENEYDPGRVPKVYHYDAELALFIMEDLSEYLIMRKGLVDRKQYPNFPEHIGRFLARSLFLSSEYALESGVKKALVKRYINPELCKLSEDVIFTDPYSDSPRNRCNPLIQEMAVALRHDAQLKLEVAKLKEKFLTHAQALVHGDLHTGSIMITETDTRVIDPEFAYYGPMGFDIGALFANLLLNHAAHIGHTPDPLERGAYQQYLLDTIGGVWNIFVEEFRSLWKDRIIEASANTEGYLDYLLISILQDTAGFTGCKMIRRIVGIAHVSDLESIADEQLRAEAEKNALANARRLIVNRSQISTINELINMI